MFRVSCQSQCSFLQALLTTYMVFIIVLFLIAVLVVNTMTLRKHRLVNHS